MGEGSLSFSLSFQSLLCLFFLCLPKRGQARRGQGGLPRVASGLLRPGRSVRGSFPEAMVALGALSALALFTKTQLYLNVRTSSLLPCAPPQTPRSPRLPQNGSGLRWCDRPQNPAT